MTTTLISATRRSVVVALVAALAMALLLTTGDRSPRTDATPAARKATSWTPSTGAVFNRPVGTSAEQRAILTAWGIPDISMDSEAAPASIRTPRHVPA